MSKRFISTGRSPSEYDRAIIVATYFGFTPIKPPRITEYDITLTKSCGNHPYYNASEKVAIIRTYLEQNLASLPHPLALVYKKPISRKKSGAHALLLIGSASGIAEATLIRTALSILSEEGYKNLRVDINCIGDKESINAYERELLGYVRKSNVNLH